MLHWNLPGTYKWLNPSHLGWVCPYLVTFYITTFQIIIIDQGSTTPISARKKKQQWTMARTKPCPDGFLIPFTVYPSMCSHTHKRHQKTEWHVYVQIICLPKKKTATKKTDILYIYKQKKSEDMEKFGRLPIFLQFVRSKMHGAAFRDLLPSGPRAQREFPKRRTVGKAFNLRYHLISFDIMWLLGGISITNDRN